MKVRIQECNEDHILACKLIIGRLSNFGQDSLDEDSVSRVKLEVCKELGLGSVPSNSELLKESEGSLHLRRKLTLKKTRNASGVIVVAVMSKPHPCPHGRCSYCPSVKGVPPSYTGREPSSMRGLQNSYDPFLQVRSRLKQLSEIGHDVDKVELIIQGGTFPSTPITYQKWFVKRCLDAINNSDSQSLDDAKRICEQADVRNAGITIETRPDWCKIRDVDLMLDLGVTRVEMGVQVLDDSIYEAVERGHRVSDVVEAVRIAKDSGLKVCFHMMPGLPGSNFESDLDSLSKVFQDARFKPDMVKIYPCLVLDGTKLYGLWKSGEYNPYTVEELVDLIVEVKRWLPTWIRVMRIQRDIPANLIVDGVKKSNLRQLVQVRLREKGYRCRCIRCREVGFKDNYDRMKLDLEVRRIEYAASGGFELFISAEDFDREVLVGYVRLRIPSLEAHRPEIEGASIVRELHVYGPMVPVGERREQDFQHRGWGKRLLAEAERETKDRGMDKILVMSGLGVKPYFVQRGYSHYGPYMVKRL